MKPSDHRRIFLQLSKEIGENRLSEAQLYWLSLVFYRIGNGEDPATVLGLSRNRGQKRNDDMARQRLSFVLHWIACYLDDNVGTKKRRVSVETACQEAMTRIVPASLKLFPGAGGPTYDVQYLSRCWYASKYAHMRSVTRSVYDPDSPGFFFSTDKPKAVSEGTVLQPRTTIKSSAR
jgi:hypothetical protein